MGGLVYTCLNRQCLDTAGAIKKHQYFRTIGKEVGDNDFHKEKESKDNVSSIFTKKT